MPEHVVLFAGPMGAGKSTAIQTLSDIEVVRTEAANTERDVVDKATTTVALDYGEITIDDVTKIRLYGTPGQRRFDFMWSILRERAEGLLLLVNDDGATPVDDMCEYLEEFRELYDRGAVVVGISRTDLRPDASLDPYHAAMAARFPELLVPIFTVDPRDVDDMRTLLLTLVANVEVQAMLVGGERG